MGSREVLLGVGVMCCVACGAKHPPYIDDSPTSSGGTSSVDGNSAAGDGTTVSAAGTKSAGTGSTGRPPVNKDGVVLPDKHGLFDFKQVYFGGLSKDSVRLGDLFTSEYIISPVADPKTYFFAFSSPPGGVVVDGELLYLRDGTLHQFVTDIPQRGNPEGNDKLVPTPGCDDGQVVRLLTSPEGRVLYGCEHDVFKLWEGDQVAYDGDEVIRALGYGDLALIGPGKFGNATTESALNLITLSDAVPAPVTGLPERFVTWEGRAQPDGFSVALSSDEQSPVELWHIGSDGTAAQVGTYPAPPDDFALYTEAMAGDEVRYLLGRSEDLNVIVQSSVDGEAKIIYREPEGAQLLMGDHGEFARAISGP
jgi:hypothetical protein